MSAHHSHQAACTNATLPRPAREVSLAHSIWPDANLSSALLFVVEPMFAKMGQLWQWGYIILLVLTVCCALTLWLVRSPIIPQRCDRCASRPRATSRNQVAGAGFHTVQPHARSDNVPHNRASTYPAPVGSAACAVLVKLRACLRSQADQLPRYRYRQTTHFAGGDGLSDRLKDRITCDFHGTLLSDRTVLCDPSAHPDGTEQRSESQSLSLLAAEPRKPEEFTARA